MFPRRHERQSEEFGIVPLAEQQRQEYPHVIYQEATDSAEDRQILLATLSAADRLGMPVVADIGHDEVTGMKTAVVRTSSDNRHDQSAQSALIHGTCRAVAVYRNQDRNSTDNADLAMQTQSAADIFIGQIVGDEKLYTSFREYYGGLRWGPDQERFTSTLFTHSAEFSPEAVESILTGNMLVSLVYSLDIENAYDTTRDWRGQSPAEIFEQKPELNYARLEDDAFRTSPQGQKLEQAYKEQIGADLAHRYRDWRAVINEEGVMLPRPLVPLSKFPVIEALLVDEVSISKPTAKYNMGPSEVVDMVVNSDSLAAQHALVDTVNTRLAADDRHVFDGPDEMQHKRRLVHSILGAYENSYGQTERQEEFKEQLLSILAAYTGGGEIAEGIRREEANARKRGFYSLRDVGGLQDIVTDILTIALASPDADSFFGRYMPDFESNITTNKDELALGSYNLKLIVLDALNRSDQYSNPDIFDYVGTKVFRDELIGPRLREITELRQQASRMMHSTDVTLARRELIRHGIGLSDSPEQKLARQAFDEASAPANAIYEQAMQAKNSLIFDCLVTLIESDQLNSEDRTANALFNKLVDRLNFGDTFEMKSLPPIYYQLLELAERSDLPDDQRDHIVWYFSNKLEHAYGDAAQFRTPVILDIYRIVLGQPGSINMPTSNTSWALDAANSVARQGAFKYASEDDLLTLNRYSADLSSLLERVLAGALSPGDGVINTSEISFEEWQKQITENIVSAARSMSTLEGYYKEYLHIEEVKLKPNVYYPWLLEKLAPFWQKMQREVSPGYSPKRDIRELYLVLKDHVDNKLVLSEEELPEDFDYFGEGHLDSLLMECYQRMVMSNDIQYNTTVWQDGLSFMHVAVALMPEIVFERFKSEYPDQTGFLKYIESGRDRAKAN